MTIKVDTSRLRRKLAAHKAARPEARVLALRVIAEETVASLNELSRKDTRRYVRGWIEAGQGAGIQSVAMPALRESRKREELLALLTEQYNDALEELSILKIIEAKWYAKGPPKTPRTTFYRDLQTRKRRQEKHIERALRELERFKANPHAIAMMRGTAAALNGYERRLDVRTLQLSVRDAPKGGSGRIVDGQDGTVLILHNLEPHSRALEKRNGTLRLATAAGARAGLRRARRDFIAKVREAAGGTRGV